MIGKDSVSSCLLGWERERGRERVQEREIKRPRSTGKHDPKWKAIVKSLLGVPLFSLNYLLCLLTFVRGIQLLLNHRRLSFLHPLQVSP